MKKALILFAIIALIAGTAMADRGLTRSATPKQGNSQSRDAVELGYDDDSFEGYGSSPDWTDETVMVVEVPAGGPYALETIRFFGFGLDDRPVVFRDVVDMVTEPGAVLDESVMFNWGVGTWDEALWVDVDVSSLGLIFDEGDLICAGTRFLGDVDGDTVMDDGIGLDDSCFYDGTCGVYWAMWSGAWGLDADFGYNDGIRFVLTGGTATREISISGVKRLY